MRRENTIQVSPKISAYLEGLHLNGIVEERVRDEHLRAPPPKKKKTSPRIRFGTVVPNGAWGPLQEDDEGVIDKTVVTAEIESESGEVEEGKAAMDTQPSQETLDSTVSSIQSSFQQEVERANRLRKEAAEANAKSLLSMQEKVNERLTAMDTTIKCVHEGQTLNDRNIQTMMTKMDIFGRQMERLEERLGQPSPATNLFPPATPQRQKAVTQTTLDDDEGDGEKEWSDDFAASPKEFDAIMSDAESKKRVAESSLARAKKPKSQPASNTRSRAQGRGT